MTSLTSVFCGPCGFDGTTKSAQKWCIHCEEGFCTDCEKYHRSMKVSRDHQFISIEDYCKMGDVSVNFFCETHNKKLDLYCKRHDMPVCLICVPCGHKSCDSTDIISIDEAAKHAKTSTAFEDLEKTISGTLESVNECVNHQDLASVTTENDTEAIKEIIEDTRKTLNQYVDELQQKLLFDLKSKHESCKSKYSNVLRELQMTEKDVETMKEQISQMKEFGTDHQVFLGTHQLRRQNVEKVMLFKDAISAAKNYRIEIKMNPMISSFLNDLQNLGAITVIENDAGLQLKEMNIEQAQSKVLNISKNISLRLQKQISVPSVSGCTILPYDRILTAHYWHSMELTEYNINGEIIRTIPVSNKPFDLTTIDAHRIAVTYGEKQYFEIINIKRNCIEKKFECVNNCWGISYLDEKMYLVIHNEGIVEMDMNGTPSNTLNIEMSGEHYVYYIETYQNLIYYTDNHNTLHCCSITGEEMWVFQGESISDPRGLVVDNNFNVFVSGYRSNNVTVVQNKGDSHKILLNADNGLYCPIAIDYDRIKNILFVGIRNGRAATYQVLYE